jgi:hypothetical protein
MKRKILREIDKIIVPITISVAMKRFALIQSIKMLKCPRPKIGSISHFFNTLGIMYANKIGIKDGVIS